MKKKVIIKFPHKHPLFKKKETKKGVYYTNSIYYFWFEFLKRNKEYIQKFEKNKKNLKGVFEDFGDIRNKNFKEWWNERYNLTSRGIYLFAYQNPFSEIEKIDRIDKIKSLKINDYTLLAIPKNIEKNYALKKIRVLISKDNKRFVNKARYEFKSKTFKIKSLKNYLKFLNLKEQGYKNWEAVAMVMNMKLAEVDKIYKISYNQIANKWSRAINKLNLLFMN